MRMSWELEELDDGPELVPSRGLQDLRGVVEVELRRVLNDGPSPRTFRPLESGPGALGDPGLSGRTRSRLARDRVPWAARACPDRVPWAARCLGESGAGPRLARAEAGSPGLRARVG